MEKREQWAELKRSIDDNLPNEPIDSIRLQDDISDLEDRIADAKSQIQKIIEENERRATRNTRIQVIQEQTREFESELHKHNAKLEEIFSSFSLCLCNFS